MAISKVIYKSSSQDTGTVWMDATPATAAAADITALKTAMLADGVLTTGTGSGGGSVTVEEKDVNFIDYDGTIVASYTAAEFADLSALPANPSHTGLTAQGWNWTLSNAKTYVASYGKLWIGQMYVTDDGKTRIYIHIPDNTPSGHMTMYVRFTQSVTYGVSVNWGDGTAAETYSGTSATNRSHTYTSTGDYMITLDVTSGKVSFVGTSSNSMFGSTSYSYNRTRIYKIEFGDNITSVGDYALYGSHAVKHVTIPQGISSIGNYAFANCTSLKSFNVPSGVTSIGNNTLYYCYSLKYVSLASSVSSVGLYAFQYDAQLASITYPVGVAKFETYIHNYCYLMKSLVIPSGITSIDASAFSSCYSLGQIIIPSSVTNIGNYAFATNYSINIVRFLPSTPPTCGTNIFNSISAGTIIYVPYSADHSILNAYKAATNLSTYASYMQEEPQ